MSWEPRLPLTAAEQHVDFEAHNDHIVLRRAAVEKATLPETKRLAVAIAAYGFDSKRGVDQLSRKLERALTSTARFGYREARREIKAMRDANRVTAYSVPDAGEYAHQAKAGLAGVLELLHRRAQETARKVADAAGDAARTQEDTVLRAAAATTAAAKVLHNHVLELVGETLNMARTAGALSFKEPPTFALRSEQLDNATCDACTEEHGQIYQVDSDDYYSHIPPTYCYGGGRCRGVYVFGDGVQDVRLPEEQAA